MKVLRERGGDPAGDEAVGREKESHPDHAHQGR